MNECVTHEKYLLGLPGFRCVEDENTLGEPKHCCSSNPDCFLPAPVTGPNDTFRPPTLFLRKMTVVAAAPAPTPTKSSVRFDVSPEAAEHNASLLREIDCDFQKFFSTQAGSTLDFGSEFRPIEQLRPLLHQHLGSEVLIAGMLEITGEERESEVLAMLVPGNHKSAQDEPEMAEKRLSKDAVHGLSMVIPKALVPLIPHAMAQPVRLAKQWTLLDDQGNRVIKCRITQDPLCSETSKKDLNCSTTRSKKEPQMLIDSRTDMEQHPEMVCGWALPRIIHFVVALRLAWPERTVIIAKCDACRRMAHSALAVVQTITTCLLLAFACLRLTFGGSPYPPTWCNFSEMVTDLANEISGCPAYEPAKLRSLNQPETPKPQRLASSIPHAPAREMAVFIPPIESGKADVFVDDVIDACLDSPENLARKPHVAPFAMHMTSKPHAGADEPAQRRAILSLPKPLAEGGQQNNRSCWVGCQTLGA
jgi:aspartate carbamoyltransferase regulatory subunit